MRWQDELAEPDSCRIEPIGAGVRRLAGHPDRNGRLLIATRDGVIMADAAGRKSLIATGAFTDAQFIGNRDVVATTEDGRVIRLVHQP